LLIVSFCFPLLSSSFFSNGSNILGCLLIEKSKFKVLLASLKTLTNSQDNSESRIRTSVTGGHWKARTGFLKLVTGEIFSQ
jgi:hypothetical protein